MTVTRISVKEVIPDVGGDFELDQGVIAELPEGSTVVEASSFGTSAWTRTARIRVQLSDGSQKAYFLKVR
jgi:protein-ribulosamine 3-kinase